MDDSVQSIDGDIKRILDTCGSWLSKEQALEILKPTGLFKDIQIKPKRRMRTIGFSIIAVCLGLIFFIGISPNPAFEVKEPRFHALALLRITLIKLLPFWNWTELYYSRCMVKNPFFEAPILNSDDCNLCETLEEIGHVSNVSQATVIEHYIKQERPFIVTDAMDNWDVMKSQQLWFDNITELFLSQGQYRVCNLNTNLRVTAYGDLGRVLKKLYSPHTEQWFLHWENCQKEGAKATRQFYQRPYFISNSLDFTGSNWILMSSEFRGRIFKKVEVGDSLLMLYQMRGFNYIRVSPREPCRGHCPELTATLSEGQILVMTNLLWMFEYIPGDVGDNLAIISEVSWPSFD